MKSVFLIACLIFLFSIINVQAAKGRRTIIIITDAARQEEALRQLRGSVENEDLLRDLNENLEDEEERRRSLADEEQAFDWGQ